MILRDWTGRRGEATIVRRDGRGVSRGPVGDSACVGGPGLVLRSWEADLALTGPVERPMQFPSTELVAKSVVCQKRPPGRGARVWIQD